MHFKATDCLSYRIVYPNRLLRDKTCMARQRRIQKSIIRYVVEPNFRRSSSVRKYILLSLQDSTVEIVLEIFQMSDGLLSG